MFKTFYNKGETVKSKTKYLTEYNICIQWILSIRQTNNPFWITCTLTDK